MDLFQVLEGNIHYFNIDHLISMDLFMGKVNLVICNILMRNFKRIKYVILR